MPEIGPEHPTTYRQELVAPLFYLLRSRESGAVIGAASMGKSRLLQFLLRADVRKHYLGEEAERTLLVWVDCNRLALFSAWGLHELLLTTLVESCGEHPATGEPRGRLNKLRKQAILSRNELLAQRHVELALQMLCKEQGLHVCFVLDEFDETYRSLPSQALASLRALRDRHKYQLSYLLFLRDHPAQLRDPEDGEGFYELVSRAVFGLKPYGEEDARRIIHQIAERRAHELADKLSAETTAVLLQLSGGHPGLLVALLDALAASPPIGRGWLEWALDQPSAREECRKLWEGLRSEEQLTLHHLAQGVGTGFQARQSLLLKGLIREEQPRQITFFSPLLEHYATEQAPPAASSLHVDAQTGAVWLNGNQVGPLTAKEFELIKYLYHRSGEICDTEQIILHLYPGDEGFDVNENAIAALVRRVRNKVEPDPKHPQFLVNVKGRGYRLVASPS
jgi:DNA-binding winged helix-turn-helix (wHTH) protein